MAAKRRPGRATKPPKAGQKMVISIAVSPDVKRFIDHEAKTHDRSLSATAELILDRARRDEAQAILFSEDQYGRQLSALLEVLGRAMRDAARIAAVMVEKPNPNWADDPFLYSQAVQAAEAVLTFLRPVGDPAPKGDVPAALSLVSELASEFMPSPANQRLRVGVTVAANLVRALRNPDRRSDIGTWAANKRDRLGSLAERDEYAQLRDLDERDEREDGE